MVKHLVSRKHDHRGVLQKKKKKKVDLETNAFLMSRLPLKRRRSNIWQPGRGRERSAGRRGEEREGHGWYG